MESRRLKIVALGSSFAAGIGIKPIIDKAAMRSGSNYAHQLAEKLNADLTDLTVSGATLYNVLDEPQDFQGKQFRPQLDSLPEDADIITLTGGGNDLGYSRGMTLDSALSYSGPLQGVLRRRFGPAGDSVNLEQLADRFILVLDRIHMIAPNAKVYLVEYPKVFGNATKPGQDTPLSQEVIQQYRDLEAVLVDAIAFAAKVWSNVDVIAMSKESEGHELGTTEPWVTGFAFSMYWRGLAPYHPTLEEHTAVANLLYQRIASHSKE